MNIKNLIYLLYPGFYHLLVQVNYFQIYRQLKLAIFVNMIILVKGTLSGKSCISTHIFVNINCIIKHEAPALLLMS